MYHGNTHEANRRKASESRMLQIGKYGSMRGRWKRSLAISFSIRASCLLYIEGEKVQENDIILSYNLILRTFICATSCGVNCRSSTLPI